MQLKARMSYWHSRVHHASAFWHFESSACHCRSCGHAFRHVTPGSTHAFATGCFTALSHCYLRYMDVAPRFLIHITKTKPCMRQGHSWPTSCHCKHSGSVSSHPGDRSSSLYYARLDYPCMLDAGTATIQFQTLLVTMLRQELLRWVRMHSQICEGTDVGNGKTRKSFPEGRCTPLINDL